MQDLQWQNAEAAGINPNQMYLVKTNGKEWRDTDLFHWPGFLVLDRLKPHVVRGRPVWIMLIVDPDTGQPYSSR